MRAFLNQLAIQLRMDIRDKGTLLVFYVVPLGFYAVVGAVFSSVNPEIKPVLSATMAIFAVSMGAFIGLPPSLVRLKEGGILRAYQVAGIPSFSVLLSIAASALIHLTVVALIISSSAPMLFGAEQPLYLGGFLVVLVTLLLACAPIGVLIGAIAKSQATAMMISQAVFMPSLMLSGIMFPANLLPAPLRILGNVFPTSYAVHAFNGLAFGLHAEVNEFLALAIMLCSGCIAVIVATRKFGEITRIG